LHARKKKRERERERGREREKSRRVADQPIHFLSAFFRVTSAAFYTARVSTRVRYILGELTNESLMMFQSLHQSSSRGPRMRTELTANVRYVSGG
jgi:hypothetical protein